MRHPFVSWFYCLRDGHKFVLREQPTDEHGKTVEWVNPFECCVCGKVSGNALAETVDG